MMRGIGANDHSTVAFPKDAPLLERMRGGLVVSCQAPAEDPFSGPEIMSRLADSVVRAGAVGIRAEGLNDLRAIRQRIVDPLIGLWKDPTGELIITPTLKHALAVAATGADILAVDGTARQRPDDLSLAQVIQSVHRQTNCLVMTDVSTFEEGVAAQAAGADTVATTLSGYTRYSQGSEGPDLDLVEELASRLTVPVFAEGRIGTPEDARRALDRGAWAVVVGTAITSPARITSRYCVALQESRA
jgi:N-acylglucosamine-6-phosphate 2-epimerase